MVIFWTEVLVCVNVSNKNYTLQTNFTKPLSWKETYIYYWLHILVKQKQNIWSKIS
jgi:hypothetical protein